MSMPTRSVTPVDPPAADHDFARYDFARHLAAARSGSRTALDALFVNCYERVAKKVHFALARDLRLKRPWLSTRFSTGDVVQDVFRSVLGNLNAFAGSTEAAFAAYLASIVRNRLLDAVRYHEADQRDGRVTKPTDQSERAVSPRRGPRTDAISSEQQRAYQAVLTTFAERERDLLRRRLEDRAEFKLLARELGYSSVSATQRAFYAAQAQLVLQLRQHLAHLDG